ncbi:MAG: hypothetical protein KJN90_03065, partial [Gammaproteobacteria bacterium]|nr:hypothetical protein [Gammaproteobacteria bacterium]
MMMTKLRFKFSLSVLLLLAMVSMSPLLRAQAIAVRNDVPRVGQQEVLMLRHAFIEKGQYQTWYQASQEGVWPWFEKIGARIVGDWQIVYPQGGSENPELDEAYRLARYASYEHWQATRPSSSASSGATGGSNLLGGNGPDFEMNNASLAHRRTVMRGSKG